MHVPSLSATSESLESHFLRFALDLIVWIQARSESDAIPNHKSYFVSFGDSGWRESDETLPDYRRYIRSGYEDVRALPSADACAKVHFDADAFSTWTTKYSQKCLERYEKQRRFRDRMPEDLFPRFRFSPLIDPSITPVTFDKVRGSYIDLLLDSVVDTLQHEGLNSSQSRLLSDYRRHREGWEAQGHRRLLFAPLENFSMEAERLEFSNGYAIEPLTADEKTEIWKAIGGHGSLLTNAISLSRFNSAKYCIRSYELVALEQDFWPAGIDLPWMDKAVDVTTAIVTAMRLHKAGNIGAAVLYSMADGPGYGVGVSLSRRLEQCGVASFGQAYTLIPEDEEPIKNIVGFLVSPEKRSVWAPISIGIRRFNYSYDREDGADQLVDLAIALENLFIGNSQGNISLRFALRGAALLRERCDPVIVNEVLRDLYRRRSKIVHEGAELDDLLPKPKDDSLTAILARRENVKVFFENVFEITRLAIIECLARAAAGESIDSIRSMLDEATVESLRIAKLSSPTDREQAMKGDS